MYLQKLFAVSVVLSGIAMTGCGRVTHADSTAIVPVAATEQPCVAGQPATTQAQASIYSGDSEEQYVSQGYVESIHRPVLIVEQPIAPVSYGAAAPVYENQPSYGPQYQGERGRDRRGRSKGRSAAIVIGSAAAGAGIGALAGGGKGAAIGAASGGTAGFIYDRLTHNRH